MGCRLELFSVADRNTETAETQTQQLYLLKEKNTMDCKYFPQIQLSRNLLVVSALQNLLFCILKAALLPSNSVGFASQNSCYCNVKQ
ncbi:hypothetical protein [Prevotella nigrescens]|uniref:hypothetical protein n=1 Tax=Prevotella nigrescens TaxID=28133 RepID=UPI00242CA11C|nr:hypothetical protein [Prevotella nigrescens]